MRFEEFLKKHEIELGRPLHTVCDEGLRRMKTAVDKHHSIGHVEGLLDELDRLVVHEKPAIRFDVLLPAICWHDVWKSTKHQTTNIIKFLYQQMRDGIGSAKLFVKYAKTILPKDLLKEIAYCIKVHARSMFFKRFERTIKTVEAQVLRDIDLLDGWHERSLEFLRKTYLETEEYIDLKKVRIAAWWYKHVTLKAQDDQLYFLFSKNEFNKRKQMLIETVEDWWEQRHRWIAPEHLAKVEGLL